MAYTTINKSTDYFNTNLYTGNNTNTAHTGIGFQPDFTWLKVRNASGAHYLFDAVRGANKDINSNDTTAEYTATQNLMSFDSDGYTVGTSNSVNTNNETMVGWNWLGANGTSANTDGTISSTVSANTTSGFSIVSYTGNGTAGATIGHGLGTVPSLIIARIKSQAKDWNVYHVSNGATKQLVLNTDAAVVTELDKWNNTTPTSSVFTVGDSSQVNMSGESGIAYCFAEKTGYSKFGSYTGNGSTDGTFVYTGFKPAYVTIKRSSNTSDWHHFDNKRAGFNGDNDYLKLNGSDSEGTSGDRIDFLSNGFKLRYATGNLNETGDTFIYNAFAEAPLVGSNGVTAKAR